MILDCVFIRYINLDRRTNIKVIKISLIGQEYKVYTLIFACVHNICKNIFNNFL